MEIRVRCLTNLIIHVKIMLFIGAKHVKLKRFTVKILGYGIVQNVKIGAVLLVDT